VDVFVRKVRRKLESAAPGWVYIHTHFGVGYRFDPDPAKQTEEAPAVPAVAHAEQGSESKQAVSASSGSR